MWKITAIVVAGAVIFICREIAVHIADGTFERMKKDFKLYIEAKKRDFRDAKRAFNRIVLKKEV